LGRREREAWQGVRLHCCTASGCLASGAALVKKTMAHTVVDRGLEQQVRVVGVGCLGMCGRGPLVSLAPSGALFERVTPPDAPSPVGSAVGKTPTAPSLDPTPPFFSSQVKVVCETSGKIDSESIEESVPTGGSQALATALDEMTPAEVIKEISQSGLRGRG